MTSMPLGAPAPQRCLAPAEAGSQPPRLLMAATCRACIRSAHLFMAAPCRACIRSAHLAILSCLKNCTGAFQHGFVHHAAFELNDAPAVRLRRCAGLDESPGSADLFGRGREDF